ncbi:MAG: dihydrofolate reductase [Bacteroidia bacterium]|nr:dihydrofolate reductase [Bacteroidia bacterium]
MKRKVLITQALFPESYESIQNRYDCIIPKENSFSKSEIIDIITDCDAILSMFNFKIDKEIIDAGNRLRIISNFGVGFNNIDIEYASKKAIVVTNTPDVVIEPTAELAFGLMLDLVRQISYADRQIRKQSVKWGVLENLSNGLNAKVLGIVGFGNIGQAIARRAVASGMKIVYNSRHRVPSYIEQKYDAKWLDLDSLLSVSDVVSVNTPYTSETHHLINLERLKVMKSNAYLINTSRGAVVDEKALIYALQNGIIAGAALDVYEQEPTIPSELIELDNVVLSPHAGTATHEVRNLMASAACQNIINFFEGGSISKVN